MTIHTRTYGSITEPNSPEEPTLQLIFTGKDLLKFQALLNRALNTAPEFGKDWFTLSSRLDNFLASHPKI